MKKFLKLSLVVFLFIVAASDTYPHWISQSDILYVDMPMVLNALPTTTQEFSPSGVLIVFSSTTTTNANGGGRSGMNAICTAEDPDAHFCSLYEIENAYVSTGVYFRNPFNKAWVDNPTRLGTRISTPDAPYGSNWIENNCGGWVSDTTEKYAHAIMDSARANGSGKCNEVNYVACCKWGP